jgi:hypothetical protein
MRHKEICVAVGDVSLHPEHRHAARRGGWARASRRSCIDNATCVSLGSGRAGARWRCRRSFGDVSGASSRVCRRRSRRRLSVHNVPRRIKRTWGRRSAICAACWPRFSLVCVFVTGRLPFPSLSAMVVGRWTGEGAAAAHIAREAAASSADRDAAGSGCAVPRNVAAGRTQSVRGGRRLVDRRACGRHHHRHRASVRVSGQTAVGCKQRPADF